MASDETPITAIARSGGIDPAAGSYRDVRLLRRGREYARIDLYEHLPRRQERAPVLPTLATGDRLIIGPAGPLIEAAAEDGPDTGLYELVLGEALGRDLLSVMQLPQATSIALLTRDREPIRTLRMEDFATEQLRHGDRVAFLLGDPPKRRLILRRPLRG